MRGALEASVQALAAKLQAALREEVGLVERAQGLEADRAALEEQVAASAAEPTHRYGVASAFDSCQTGRVAKIHV